MPSRASLPDVLVELLRALAPTHLLPGHTHAHTVTAINDALKTDNDLMRVSVRVKPGASKTKVGGQYGQVAPGARAILIVFVAQRAVDGAATEGLLKAVAKAFGLRRGDVELVKGLTSRTKVLELHGQDQPLAARLAELLAS
jgi:uncharacterized protein YggU (UPF0235/DUF167 family)